MRVVCVREVGFFTKGKTYNAYTDGRYTKTVDDDGDYHVIDDGYDDYFDRTFVILKEDE